MEQKQASMPILLNSPSFSYIPLTAWTVHSPVCGFSADMVINQLNDGGIVRVVSLFAGEPDASFLTAVTSFPENWLNVASPQTGEYFDMRVKPACIISTKTIAS